jgi:hypothetical protein
LELEFLFPDVAFVPMIDNIGSAEEPLQLFANLTKNWPVLVHNLNLLHEMVAGAKKVKGFVTLASCVDQTLLAQW